MEVRLRTLTRDLKLNTGAAEPLITLTEQQLGIFFPRDHKEFVSEANGAEGLVGAEANSYLALWPLQDIRSRNWGCRVSEFAPGLLLFASDGAEQADAFDLRDPRLSVVEVPFIPLALEEAQSRGASFLEFLESLSNRAVADSTKSQGAWSRKRFESDRARPELYGLAIHEIHPVKLGGSPTDPANRVALPGSIHDQYTVWWNQALKKMQR